MIHAQSVACAELRSLSGYRARQDVFCVRKHGHSAVDAQDWHIPSSATKRNHTNDLRAGVAISTIMLPMLIARRTRMCMVLRVSAKR